MFDFRKEVIINTANLPAEEGSLPRVTKDSTYLKVLRCAEYKLENIKNMVKILPEAGTCASVQLAHVPTQELATVVITLGLDRHRAYGEFANNWAKTEKVLVVDSDSEGTLDSIVSALKQVVEANPIVSVSSGGLVTCKDKHMIIKSVEYIDNEGNSIDMIDEYGSGEPLITINKGKRPVNTGEMLIENLRFPSYPNLRYAATNEEERPIPGELYDLYVFDYVVPRVGLHGQGAVGQQLTSSTTHAFYVRKGIYTSENNPFEKIAG